MQFPLKRPLITLSACALVLAVYLIVAAIFFNQLTITNAHTESILSERGRAAFLHPPFQGGSGCKPGEDSQTLRA
jgi:hypothetical protein